MPSVEDFKSQIELGLGGVASLVRKVRSAARRESPSIPAFSIPGNAKTGTVSSQVDVATTPKSSEPQQIPQVRVTAQTPTDMPMFSASSGADGMDGEDDMLGVASPLSEDAPSPSSSTLNYDFDRMAKRNTEEHKRFSTIDQVLTSL